MELYMSKKDTSKTSEPKFENIDYYHTISLNLNHYRRCMGYTQAMLAEKADLTSSYLSQIESINTVRSFSMETFFDLARALEIEPYKLLKPLDDDM